MRIHLLIDVPDYSQGKQVHEHMSELCNYLQSTAWQMMSGQIVGWTIEKDERR